MDACSLSIITWSGGVQQCRYDGEPLVRKGCREGQPSALIPWGSSKLLRPSLIQRSNSSPLLRRSSPLPPSPWSTFCKYTYREP